MQIFSVEYVSVHVRVGGTVTAEGMISARGVFRDSCARTPWRHSLCFSQELGKFYKLSCKMNSHEHTDDGIRWRIVGRLETGQSQLHVATKLDVTPSVVCNVWKQFQDTGSISRRPGQGRRRATMTNEDRYLALSAWRHRTATDSQLSRELHAATGTRVSRFTVARRLHERGLYARRPAVCVPLTAAHKRAHLAWCRQHQPWTRLQWSTMLFTDESRFSLDTDSRRTLIWREPMTRYHPSHIREMDHYGGGGVMVWAGIMLDSRTPLHVFDRGSLTAMRYREEILEPYVRLFRGAVGLRFLFMDDNKSPHRAHLVDVYLESENIRRMDWPARSPDLKPIEHIWDALGRAIASRHPPPRTIPELKTALLQEWDRLPQGLLNCLVSSMPSRCVTCLTVRGDHTPY